MGGQHCDNLKILGVAHNIYVSSDANFLIITSLTDPELPDTFSSFCTKSILQLPALWHVFKCLMIKLHWMIVEHQTSQNLSVIAILPIPIDCIHIEDIFLRGHF